MSRSRDTFKDEQSRSRKLLSVLTFVFGLIGIWFGIAPALDSGQPPDYVALAGCLLLGALGAWAMPPKLADKGDSKKGTSALRLVASMAVPLGLLGALVLESIHPRFQVVIGGFLGGFLIAFALLVLRLDRKSVRDVGGQRGAGG